MIEMTREIATAAQWWAEQLPKQKPNLADQAGAQPTDAMNHPVARGLFDVLADREAQSVTPEGIETFRVELAKGIAAMVEKADSYWADSARSGFNVVVATDYGPDSVLGDALAAAGMNGRSMTLLPNKTVMWVKPGKVDVSAGYGAAIESVPLVEDSRVS